MSKVNENKFYQALEDVFTGANIEGESGYVNLMKIKASYYKKILEQFKKEIYSEEIISDSFKEEFFDKLYSFFEKYFSESGSVYFVKTANWQRVYEQVYTDNKDVVLFWKTHMLYYVKSDILFQSINVEVPDEENKTGYNFYFDAGTLEAKKNNEKREIIFSFREIREEKDNVKAIKGEEAVKTYIFDVAYSENGNKTKTDDIVKKTKLPEEILAKAFNTFRKQAEVDFFINKNAEKFLSGQLDLYLHQILLNEENKFNQDRLDQIKTIKTFARKIIGFIAQFEDELVRIWNKPKFALNSNYVITIDKLPEKILNKLTGHKNLNDQIKEWQELGMVDDKFDFAKREEKHKYLPIDTKFFKDLEIEILGIFENIDEALDGRLIHSENYQALNTLQEKYKEKVQCIYIDPPFNTGTDFAYVDKFQDSTWLSLMNDRIELAKKLLREDGSFYLHLDHNADYLGRGLMNKIYGLENFRNELIWQYGKMASSTNRYLSNNDIIIFYAKADNTFFRKIYTRLEKTKKFLAREVRDGKLINARDENGKIIYIEKNTKIVDTVWNDIPTVMPASAEFQSFQTQKPEKLLERIFIASSDANNLIIDFFAGSATTISAAHKMNRKWIGVEMGEHFETVALRRIKAVLFGKISGISNDMEKENKLKKGGFFKYYSLEQYENTLRNMKYKDDSPKSIFDDKKPFEEYIFYADQKFAYVLEVNKDSLDVDFENLYPNIDFAETISNLLGLPIKRVTKTSVVLADKDGENGEREINTDYKNMPDDEKLEFVRLLKPLLWWGK